MSREEFRLAARDQRVCAVTQQGGRAYHAHHVVRKSDVEKHGGDPNDPRNALRVIWQAHLDHHWGNRRIKVIELLDENIEFAYELLGDYAGDYLRRRYEGDDPRLQSEVSHA